MKNCDMGLKIKATDSAIVQVTVGHHLVKIGLMSLFKQRRIIMNKHSGDHTQDLMSTHDVSKTVI